MQPSIARRIWRNGICQSQAAAWFLAVVVGSECSRAWQGKAYMGSSKE